MLTEREVLPSGHYCQSNFKLCATQKHETKVIENIYFLQNREI